MTHRTHRLNLALLYVCSVLSNFSYGTYVMFIIPLYTKAFGIGDDWYGYILAASMFAWVLTSIPGGHLSDIVGRKKMVFAGWCVMGAGILLLIPFQIKWVILTASVLIGIGQGLSSGPAQALIADVIKQENLSKGYGTIQGVAMLVSAAGPLTMGLLIDSLPYGGTGVKVSLLACAYLALVAAALALLFTEQKNGTDAPKLSEIFSLKHFTPYQKKVVRDLSIAQGITGFGAGLTVPFYSIFFINKFSAGATQLGYIFMAGTLAVAFLTLFVGFVGDRVNKLKFMVVGNASAVPMALGVTLAPTLALGGVFYVLRQSIANMIWPVWSAFMMQELGRNVRGKSLGITQTTWNLCWVFGSLAGGHVTGLLRGWAFPIVAVGYLCSMVFIWADLGRKKKIVTEEPAPGAAS
ncbi:MAG: hypothetical protein CVT48_02815 [Thermoplasmata archaeon HGW-Thermoplasmata-1]|nr:MAG: hypothetical protein CVT48_02815 [Thermoplasmata archaeon HGW-Thermoplasmata-1]